MMYSKDDYKLILLDFDLDFKLSCSSFNVDTVFSSRRLVRVFFDLGAAMVRFQSPEKAVSQQTEANAPP